MEALADAKADQTEAAEELEEKFEELAADTVIGFTAGAFDVTALEDYELAAEAEVFGAQIALNTARQTKTDAELNKDLQDAQKAVNEDTGRYTKSGAALHQDGNGAVVRVYASSEDLTANPLTWSTTADTTNSKFVGYALDGTISGDNTNVATKVSPLADGNFTAKQLQNFVSSTKADYEGNIAQKGSSSDLAAELKDAIVLYLAQNADVGGTALATLDGVVDTYVGIAAPNHVQDTTFYTGVMTAYNAVFSGGTNNDESILDADSDRSAALEELLATLDKRGELSSEWDDAVAGFTAVEGLVFTGGATDVTTAQGAVDARDDLIKAVTKAQADAAELAELIEAYTTASGKVDDASEELGYTVEDIDEAVEFGTDEDDLFILDLKSLEASGIDELSILDAAAGDIIYFGSDYTLGTDIEAGDNNATEIFITEDGGNTVVTIETETYGSNTGDVIELTLVGVENVTFEDGVLAIA